MSDVPARQGGCHCGKVRFEAKADLGKVISCNCSICAKQGLWLTFVPSKDFKLLSGEDNLRDYQFASKRIHHLFCTDCGVESFGRGTAPDGGETYAINVRCLDGVDVSTLSPGPFDGKKL
jgi:hypothetical protein